jgi:hypothetical protein
MTPILPVEPVEVPAEPVEVPEEKYKQFLMEEAQRLSSALGQDIEFVEGEEKDDKMKGEGMLYVPIRRRLNAMQFGRGIRNRRHKHTMMRGILKAGNDNKDIIESIRRGY